MIDLFRQKIVPSDLSMLKSLRVNGLECIVRLFVLVNELQGNVLDLDPQAQSGEATWQQSYAGYQSGSAGQGGSQGYGSTGYYQPSYQQDTTEAPSSSIRSGFNRFRVNILPQDLEGINILWSLLEACDTGNSNLFYMVQRTLINIYSNLSTTLDSERQFINDSFIQACLSCLKSMHSDNSSGRSPK